MSLSRFSDLSRFRVHDILLVSSVYDAFILAEDGELQEVILKQFLDLNVRSTPGVTHVADVETALALARDRARFNLIIASAALGDVSAETLARRLRDAGIDTPVVALAYDMREVAQFTSGARSAIERVFLWQGDVRLVPAIVKYLEDRVNVAHDTGVLGVQAVLVIEDNVRYYSSFLPMIHAELMEHAHRLVPEGVNLSHKLMRLQAQPKVLLCTTYEEAWRYFIDFEPNILGIVSDIEFPRGGRIDPEAGLEFAREVHHREPDIPIMLESSRVENQWRARDAGASFLLKGSSTLLHQLRRFMTEQLGFGDFVFRTPDGREVARAHDLRELEDRLATVPGASLAYHGERNHFSNWFKARTEFALAERLRPRKVSDFPTVEDLRSELIRAIQEHRRDTSRGVIVDFDRDTVPRDAALVRIGGGALGGKARGLAFVDLLISQSGIAAQFPQIRVTMPEAAVLATDVFDEFVEMHDLRAFALESSDEQEIEQRFVGAELPKGAERDLTAFVAATRYPLAVRSSSLLEDSQYQPFAGIYQTFMLPNDHERTDVRVRQLLTAVKRVYASTFSRAAKRYLAESPYRLEEEKMAVVLQRVVGGRHGRRFYPDIGGVARSHNFYPLPPMKSEDGLAAVALGLGETVVGGGACFRFCPRYPRHVVQFSAVADILANAQREFYALELGGDSSTPFSPVRFDIADAERDGTLAWVGSSYSRENDVVYDGVSRPGVRVVTFAPILKHGLFPLAPLVDALLKMAASATGAPVELEFAAQVSSTAPPEFGVLQLRPLGRIHEGPDATLPQVERSRVICSSDTVLGHGSIDGICDLVVVDPHRFDRFKTREIAKAVAQLNAELAARRRPYVLIGVGRWGSADPLLGIPVTWDQIAGARAIVEAGFADFRVTPSQGSHFFQNLTAGDIGYFTVNPDAGDGFVDWQWLAEQPAVSETEFVRHLRFASPIGMAINGRAHTGLIVKPEPSAISHQP